MKKTKNAGWSLEASMQRLNDIVEKLESGEVSLDDAMNLYEEGMIISKQCMEKLSQAELKLKQIRKDMDGTLKLSDGIDEQ
jgi:exodeoxyribonuclease VII small subunit